MILRLLIEASEKRRIFLQEEVRKKLRARSDLNDVPRFFLEEHDLKDLPPGEKAFRLKEIPSSIEEDMVSYRTWCELYYFAVVENLKEAEVLTAGLDDLAQVLVMETFKPAEIAAWFITSMLGHVDHDEETGGFEIFSEYDIFWGGKRVNGTAIQKKLLIVLIEAQGKMVSYNQLIKQLWPDIEKNSRPVLAKNKSVLDTELSSIDRQLHIIAEVDVETGERGYRLIMPS